MKADNPFFMCCVALREVEDFCAKARTSLEEGNETGASALIREATKKIAEAASELFINTIRKRKAQG